MERQMMTEALQHHITVL